jgi:hypothetical protein
MRTVARVMLLMILAATKGFSQNIEGQIVASQFGAFQVPGINTGSLQFSPASCQVSGGGKNFDAFSVGVPIKIVDSNPALNEIDTPTAVFPKQCAVSMATTYIHATPFYLTSGTGGLQEAIINGPVKGGGPNTIILNADWYTAIAPQSAATVIGATKGNTSMGLVDVTTTPYTYYQWSGTQYAAVASGGGASTPATALVLKGNGVANGVIAATPNVDYLNPSYWSTLTGCATVGYVWTPQSATCVAGGGISGQASGVIPLASTSTTIAAQSHVDDGNTTAGTVTSTEPVTAPGFTSDGAYDGYTDYSSTGTTNPTGPASGTVRVTVADSGITAYTIKWPLTAPSSGNTLLSCPPGGGQCVWVSSGSSSGFTIANNGYLHGSSTPATTATLTTFSSALTSGSLIIVHQYSAAASSYSVPTDTAGNTYVDCGPGAGSFNANADNFECWYALNTHTTASNVVTVHASSVAYLSGMAFEILGAASSSPIDGGSGVGYSTKSNATGGAAGSNNLSATALTPTGNGDLIVAFFAAGNGATVGTSPNAFTLVNAGWIMSSEYFTQTTSAAITATGSDSASSDPYGAVVVAIKP